MSEFKKLSENLEQVMLVDKYKYLSTLRYIKTLKDNVRQQKLLVKLKRDINFAKEKLNLRKNLGNLKNISFPEELPVSVKKAEILQLIKKHQVVIVAGETGSGKTTQLPKICLELGLGNKGLIGHTQPRRIAARTVANRISEELNVELGDIVGYKIRFGDKISSNTKIKLMTDGILLAEMQQDKFLNQYDTLIIDEAHERSLNNDFILGYLKQLLTKRKDLKIIITSATIDVERFSKHFDNAPIIEISGRMFPVEILYRPISDRQDLDLIQGIIDAVYELKNKARGDILIFLNGEKEIRDITEILRKENFKHTEVLPLYARLSIAEQNKIFHPYSMDRIILATNVAETSLTVPGIKYVIDTGTARISRYSYRTKVQHLEIEAISQASANQRKGRCGRISAGICIRLYSEEDFNNRAEFTDPEILRTNLASVILQMLNLQLAPIDQFPFIDKPDIKNIQDGYKLLNELQAVDKTSNGYKLTMLGNQIARLPLDPVYAKMIIAATNYNCLYEIMIIVAKLSIQDPCEYPLDKKQQANEKHARFHDKNSDFMAMINLWNYVKQQELELTKNQFRKQCASEYLSYIRLREWQEIYTQLRTEVRSMGLKINSFPATYQEIHLALLSGLLSNIGMKDAEKPIYLGARNTNFNIVPNSSIFKLQPKWIICAELISTNKLWARYVAKIDPEWIESLAKHVVKRNYNQPRWMKSKGQAIANEKVTLYGLPIVIDRIVNYAKIDPQLSRQLFIQSALIEGNWTTKHKFFFENQNSIKEIEKLEHKIRKRNILVNEETLFEFYDQRISLDVVSVKHFDAWWNKKKLVTPDLLNFEKSFLMKNDNEIDKADYPNFWKHNNMKLRLSYQFEPGKKHDGVTVHIPLPVLNQINADEFFWNIPALREELVIAIIKTLPKALRKNFVPTPNYANAFLEKVTTTEKPLLECLIDELKRMTGIKLTETDFALENIPSHLLINFRIEDLSGKLIDIDKDFTILRSKLSEQVQKSLSYITEIKQDNIEITGMIEWNFGNIEQCYTSKQKNILLKAYPALVDEKKSVGIKLFETELEQEINMRAGLRRLCLLNIASPLKYIHEKLPNKAKLSLYFNTFGKVLELVDDCVNAGIDHLINQNGGIIWQQHEFPPLKDYVKANINEITVTIAEKVERILLSYNRLNKKIKSSMNLTHALALNDISIQMNNLIFKGFVSKHGMDKLPDLERYFLAIEKRLEKLFLEPNKDRDSLLKVEKVQKLYLIFKQKSLESKELYKKSDEIFYMIEEYRVSLFAQQIKTKYPISEKRIITALSN